MNDKEFFKEVLKDELPDFEKVRNNILKTSVSSDDKIKSLNSQMFMKRVLPAVACVAIIAISSFAALNTENSDKVDIVQGTRKNFSSSQKQESKKKKKNNSIAVTTKASIKNNKNKNPKNKKTDKKNNDSTSITEPSEESYKKVDDSNNYLSSSPKKSSFSFYSISELKKFASKLKVADDNTVYYDDEENTFRLTFEKIELSMILKSHNVFIIKSDGSKISHSGVIKRINGIVCCEFSYKEYKVGYTLSKTSISNNNYKTRNIDGYCCFIDSDSEEAEELLKDFTFSVESI
ncbi:MAG: hypothetical protein IJO19_02040 [Clostridia bacterium]|nr:hypothetical protein [Clostridia bacterium]